MKPLPLLCGGLLAAAVLAAAAPPRAARAQNAVETVDAFDAIARLGDAPLERMFWDCDRLSTRIALPLDTGALCARAADELKRRRFDGDFERMLAWWHANKAAQHAQGGAAAALR